jgi:outer membrane lipopolysaccharide assembly protein LptE/RlpB
LNADFRLRITSVYNLESGILNRKILNSLKAALIPIVILSLLVGCGYRFAGAGKLPAGIGAIFVTTLENRTMDTGIESILTSEIIAELIRNDPNHLAVRERADAVLSGTIDSVRSETISRRSVQSAFERRLFVTVSLRLTDRSGKVIWSAPGFSVNEAYQVREDKTETDQTRRAAFSALSRRLAEAVYNRITEDF